MKIFPEMPFEDRGYKVLFQYRPAPMSVEYLWKSLESVNGGHIFTSWLWISSWLSETVDDQDYYLLTIEYEHETVAACIFISSDTSRNLFVHSHQLFINEYPKDGRNMVIEYNSILIKPEHKTMIINLLVKFFQEQKEWDELVVSAISEQSIYPSFSNPAINKMLQRESISRGVDLQKIEISGNVTISQILLSKNKRSQINRSIRRYQSRFGKAQIHIADTTEQAFVYFSELGKLHTEYWRSKGKNGSFSNSRWVAFHSHLIKTGFQSKNIQICRVAFGDEVIGYLYNLVWDNKVYNIQSGFNYTLDNRDKPGLICHLYTIEKCFEDGYEYYDMLAGDEDYKKSFANSEIKLQWLVFQRRRARFLLENLLKKFKRLISS